MTPSASSPGNGKVKVSNLPLLFVNGQPTSLECMNLEELQRFFRFMLKCEMYLAEAPNLDDMLDQPAWWPPDLAFSETILTQRHHRGKLSIQLRDAIKRCYKYHNCSCLIDFSRRVIAYTGGVYNIEVVDNMNGTRSLIKKPDNKLLVTFRAENQDYDRSVGRQEARKLFSAKTPMKLSDTRRLAEILCENSSDPGLARVEEEVYLCDHCDLDFNSLPDLMLHEKMCGKSVEEEQEKEEENRRAALSSVTDTTTAYSTTSTTATSGSGQRSKYEEQFFDYLRLGRPGRKAPAGKKQTKGRTPRAVSYEKFVDIPLSSPLGIFIIHSSRLGLNQQNSTLRGYKSQAEYVAEVEARCPGTIKTLRYTNAFHTTRDKFILTYRRQLGLWCHLYSFTVRERLARLKDIQNGLSLRAFRLWKRTAAKKSIVRLKRLPVNIVEIAHLNQNIIQVSRLGQVLPPEEMGDHPVAGSQERSLRSFLNGFSYPRQRIQTDVVSANTVLPEVECGRPAATNAAAGRLQYISAPARLPEPHLGRAGVPIPPGQLPLPRLSSLPGPYLGSSSLPSPPGLQLGSDKQPTTPVAWARAENVLQTVITLSDSDEEPDSEGNQRQSWHGNTTISTYRPAGGERAAAPANPSAEFRPGPNHPQKPNQRPQQQHYSASHYQTINVSLEPAALDYKKICRLGTSSDQLHHQPTSRRRPDTSIKPAAVFYRLSTMEQQEFVGNTAVQMEVEYVEILSDED